MDGWAPIDNELKAKRAAVYFGLTWKQNGFDRANPNDPHGAVFHIAERYMYFNILPGNNNFVKSRKVALKRLGKFHVLTTQFQMAINVFLY